MSRFAHSWSGRTEKERLKLSGLIWSLCGRPEGGLHPFCDLGIESCMTLGLAL